MAEVNDILASREKTHGVYKDHASISQTLKGVMRREHGWGTLSLAQQESLEMIAHKIARILNGNPDVEDHWDDIAGYATLVSKIITKDKAAFDETISRAS